MNYFYLSIEKRISPEAKHCTKIEFVFLLGCNSVNSRWNLFSRRLLYDNTTRKTRNQVGVDIVIPGFGNTSSVEWLDSSQLAASKFIALCRAFPQTTIDSVWTANNRHTVISKVALISSQSQQYPYWNNFLKTFSMVTISLDICPLSWQLEIDFMTLSNKNTWSTYINIILMLSIDTKNWLSFLNTGNKQSVTNSFI